MANEEELINPEEAVEGQSEEQADERVQSAGVKKEKSNKGKIVGSVGGILEGEIKKQLTCGFIGGVCACCLPIIVILASVGTVTIVVFYIQGFFDSSSNSDIQTSESQAAPQAN